MLKPGNHAAAHRAAGQPHGGWLAYHPKGYAMTIAPTLHRYLAAENIEYAEIPHALTMSSARTAQACHVPGDHLAKAVVLRHDGGYMLAVVPASHHVNLPDLKARLGEDLAMANEGEINRLFADCAPGAVPAVGRCYGLDLIVDDSIQAQPKVYIEAGDHETLLQLTHAQFARLTGSAPHGRFSVHD
jgi:Ala-tRNA(Pro) deacylase